MNRDEIKGKIDQVKGDLKERVGGATKDRKTQAEGMMDQVKGKVREGFGKLQGEADKEEGREEERSKRE